jgi:hypothetical protein
MSHPIPGHTYGENEYPSEDYSGGSVKHKALRKKMHIKHLGKRELIKIRNKKIGKGFEDSPR